MILFGKEIVKAYVIDFFPDPTITEPLRLFLARFAVTKVLVPKTTEEVMKFLSTIEQEIGDEGCLLHLVGHGDNGKLGFGRIGLSFRYEEMISPFSLINAKCSDKLIINASLMCLTDPFHSIYIGDPSIFHACIFSTETRSAQMLRQMINIYRKCEAGSDTRTAIEKENDNIEDAQDVRPFGYS